MKIRGCTKKYEVIGLNKSCYVPLRQYSAINKGLSLIAGMSPSIQKVVLFGSCARSEARFGSDIDFCFVLKKISEWGWV